MSEAAYHRSFTRNGEISSYAGLGNPIPRMSYPEALVCLARAESGTDVDWASEDAAKDVVAEKFGLVDPAYEPDEPPEPGIDETAASDALRHARAGQRDEALIYLARAVESCPDAAEACRLLART